MFWECHIASSSIDKLLDQSSDTIKLQDFLDESDLIQECLTQNKRVIDYLIQSNIMNELIHHVITYPENDDFRNAYVVSELLSGDFQRIQEKLLEKEHLDLLYSFLLSNQTDEQLSLNPILASYFSRIFMTLIIRKSAETLNYFKSRSTFKEDFLRHLSTTSIIDILYRLIADSGEQRSEALKWYEDINLIDALIQQLLITDSTYVQMNIVNLLSEFLRLAFDQHNGMDNDIQGINSTSLSTMERLLFNRNEIDEESSSSNELSSNKDAENKSTNNESDGKITPLVLAEHILSKSNLERLFDTLSKRPILVANGCDFLITVLDLLARYIPAPMCISIKSFLGEKSVSKDESSSSDKDEHERMQINDEGDTLPVIKSHEKSSDGTNANVENLTIYAKDPHVRIYLLLLQVIPSRLPQLISLLSKPSAPLITSSVSSSPSHDSSQTVKYQFISEPLGAMRLNLIKFFSKLIYTISNDYTGDYIYQILESNQLLNIMIDLFYHHIYNNFLHTQVYMIIHRIVHINSLAAKQPDSIWARVPLTNQIHSSESESRNLSSLHYTNRYSYKIFESLLTSSKVNLIERLLDQYELNIATNRSVLTSSSSDDAITLHTRFASPNSGHIVQILRCLQEHASVFNNYSTFFKTVDQNQIDENTNLIDIRWQTAIDYLGEDEKKCQAMHHNERNNTNNFRINSATHIMAQIKNALRSNDSSSETNQRRQAFHLRSFASGGPYIDDDDDDDVQTFDIDDEVMNDEQTSGERKEGDIKKTSFDPQFPPVFDDQPAWYQQEDTDAEKTYNDNRDKANMKMVSNSQVPDLFENYSKQQEKSGSSTESSFEQLCSLRANDHGGAPVMFPSQSASTVRDENDDGRDEF